MLQKIKRKGSFENILLPDGKEVVLLSEEKSTDETTVYTGDDGKTYISEEYINYTIKDKDGKENKLENIG